MDIPLPCTQGHRKSISQNISDIVAIDSADFLQVE
jgi:hypothetical protein